MPNEKECTNLATLIIIAIAEHLVSKFSRMMQRATIITIIILRPKPARLYKRKSFIPTTNSDKIKDKNAK